MNLVISLAIVVLAVTIHDASLHLAADLSEKVRRRFRPSVCVLVVLVAHHVEVALFAAGWYALIALERTTLVPAPDGALDLLYFSGAVYTSLGFGDIVPEGPGRLFAVTEAVTGLVLIAWSASFTFLQMQRNWPRRSA